MKQFFASHPFARSLILALAIILIFVIYAYGFQVTKVNLEETRSERRQTQLTRIIRSLARPDVITYDYETSTYTASLMIPCPQTSFSSQSEKINEGYITITPSCADEKEMISIEGFNLPSNFAGNIYFVPPSNVQISIGSTKTDDDGHFIAEVKLPERASPEIQFIQFEVQQKIGNPYISKNAIDTLDKIIETVFLALLATTLGILVAIPLSFFAARNLMQDVTLTLTGIAINLILLPISVLLGIFVSTQIHTLSSYLANSTLINLISIGCGIGLIMFVSRLSSAPSSENKINFNKAWIKTGITFIIGLLILIILYLISDLLMSFGPIIANNFAFLTFIGSFLIDLGDIIQMLLPLFISIAAFGIASQYAGRLSLTITRRLKPQPAKLVQIILSVISGAVLLLMLAGGLIWLYQLDNIQNILMIAGGVGGAIGLLFGLMQKPNKLIPIGMVIFYGARTIFNSLRAIEPIIMVIVFVVWVGIGPFAGVLALSMHTIAALAKLYSEQVESILQGPIEAVRATGANRLQTIVYAVIPQIIPPYISLTMDRWDINVRMSTVIGLGGGGGIGFLLIQNINLLNYRQASTQMIAIAIVVATMDYISSKTRQKVI